MEEEERKEYEEENTCSFNDIIKENIYKYINEKLQKGKKHLETEGLINKEILITMMNLKFQLSPYEIIYYGINNMTIEKLLNNVIFQNNEEYIEFPIIKYYMNYEMEYILHSHSQTQIQTQLQSKEMIIDKDVKKEKDGKINDDYNIIIPLIIITTATYDELLLLLIDRYFKKYNILCETLILIYREQINKNKKYIEENYKFNIKNLYLKINKNIHAKTIFIQHNNNSNNNNKFSLIITSANLIYQDYYYCCNDYYIYSNYKIEEQNNIISKDIYLILLDLLYQSKVINEIEIKLLLDSLTINELEELKINLLCKDLNLIEYNNNNLEEYKIFIIDLILQYKELQSIMFKLLEFNPICKYWLSKIITNSNQFNIYKQLLYIINGKEKKDRKGKEEKLFNINKEMAVLTSSYSIGAFSEKNMSWKKLFNMNKFYIINLFNKEEEEKGIKFRVKENINNNNNNNNNYDDIELKYLSPYLNHYKRYIIIENLKFKYLFIGSANLSFNSLFKKDIKEILISFPIELCIL